MLMNQPKEKALRARAVYSLKTRNFDDDNYYVEDVTSVVETYQKMIFQIIDELIDTSFAVMNKFEGQYTSK